MEFKRNTPTGTVQIEGAMDVLASSALQTALSTCLTEAPTLKLDLSDVVSCDVAGVQVLCSARKTAASLGKTLVVVAVSPSVTELCLAIGVSLDDLGHGCVSAKLEAGSDSVERE